MKAMSGFDPNKSKISTDKLGHFLRNPMGKDVLEIPGMDRMIAQSMADEGITTTFQVMGKFLSFAGPNTTAVEVCDLFWAWLGTHRARSATQSGITECFAERVNMILPEFNYPNYYDDMIEAGTNEVLTETKAASEANSEKNIVADTEGIFSKTIELCDDGIRKAPTDEGHYCYRTTTFYLTHEEYCRPRC